MTTWLSRKKIIDRLSRESLAFPRLRAKSDLIKFLRVVKENLNWIEMMGIYYYAVDYCNKQYFSSPGKYSIKSPGIYHPNNPFPHMVIMKNIQGFHFQILNDMSNDIPPSNDYEDVTDKVYAEYVDKFKEVVNAQPS